MLIEIPYVNYKIVLASEIPEDNYHQLCWHLSVAYIFIQEGNGLIPTISGVSLTGKASGSVKLKGLSCTFVKRKIFNCK